MTDLHWAAVVAAICVLAEGFFSGSELAVVAADRIKIRQQAEAPGGARAYRLLQSFLQTPQRLLATTLLGTQIAIVTATVTVTLALGRRYSTGKADLLTLLCLTPALVILGEIVPKALLQQNADKIAPRIVYPLWLFSLIFSPVVFVMVRFTGVVSRLLGIDAQQRKLVSREDLELIVKGEGRRAGGITEGERRMISRIFDFGERTAYDVMVPLSSVVVLEETTTLEQVVREVEDKGFTRFPVYRERVDRIVGIVHAFEVLKGRNKDLTVGALANPPIYAPENQPVLELLVNLQRQRQGMAVVVDEYGGAVGVVTIEDILEEIVGEIEDEFDESAPAIRKEAEGVWKVRATTSIVEVNRQLKLGLPEGSDYETLAGLVLDQLKHIPRVGEVVRVGAVLIKVSGASERAVEEVELKLAKRRGS